MDTNTNVIHKDNKIVNEEEEDFAFDLDLDEDEVLKRYHTMYTLIKKSRLLKPKSQYDTSNVQSSIVDFSVCFALQGGHYMEEIQMNSQYTVLQAALILTITIPMYVSPPELSSDKNIHLFSFFVGFSAFLHLFTIIGITILSALFNRPYTEADTVLVRIENNTLFAVITTCNYISIITFIIAVLIAGFDRSSLDGGVQCYILLFVIYLFHAFIKSSKEGDNYQDARVLAFYRKYCINDGSLQKMHINTALTKKAKD